VREFDKEGPRADGPPVVWTGPELGPALVVIDPTGAAKHAELPGTWHRLAETHQIAWCRLPASRKSLEDIEDVLESLAERRPPVVAMVASGDACPAAVALAGQFDDLVKHVLLVDPTPDTPESGLTTVVARSTHDDLDRVAAPLPIGHPDVVAGVVAVLAGNQS
jgi:pimeloyl-ACP methyl ester carboxylesterase